MNGSISSDASRLLRIYLQDHEGAAAGGVRLAQRAAKANAGRPCGQALQAIAQAIMQDRRSLQSMLQQLGIRPNRLKAGASWLGATLGALKLNGRVLSYSPLSRVLELEALSAAVAAKRTLWLSLQNVTWLDQPLSAELPALIARADDQVAKLQALHDGAARAAFDRDD